MSVIPNSVGRLDDVVDAIRNGDWDRAIELLDVEQKRLAEKYHAIAAELDKCREACSQVSDFEVAIRREWPRIETEGRAMRRDENGVAVPGQSFKLPLRHLGAKGVPAEVIDAAGVTVAPVIYSLEMADFIVHAANYHACLADIVRRLAEWHVHKDDTIDILPIVADAAELWEEMQKEGGGK
jgi:hypothetical protein